jgi:transcriptional activator SPT7
MSLYSDYLLTEPHLSNSIPIAGPYNPDKSRSKEKDKDAIQAIVPPPWYPTGSPEDEDLRSEGLWWGLMQKDDAYVSAIPATPSMLPATPLRRKQIGKRKRRDDSPSYANGTREGEERTPPLEWPKAVNLESVMNRSVDKLFEARRIMGQIHDWQRIESEGGVLPNLRLMEAEEKERAKEEKEAWRQQRRTEAEEKKKRHKAGGEVGELEAVLSMKKAAANVLALSGFEGESPMKMIRLGES